MRKGYQKPVIVLVVAKWTNKPIGDSHSTWTELNGWIEWNQALVLITHRGNPVVTETNTSSYWLLLIDSARGCQPVHQCLVVPASLTIARRIPTSLISPDSNFELADEDVLMISWWTWPFGRDVLKWEQPRPIGADRFCQHRCAAMVDFDVIRRGCLRDDRHIEAIQNRQTQFHSLT